MKTDDEMKADEVIATVHPSSEDAANASWIVRRIRDLTFEIESLRENLRVLRVRKGIEPEIEVVIPKHVDSVTIPDDSEPPSSAPAA